MARKTAKLFKFLKLVALTLVVCAVIAHFPIVPHKIASAIVYVAQGVTHATSAAIALAAK